MNKPPKDLAFVEFFPWFWDYNPLPVPDAISLVQSYFISIIEDGTHGGDCTRQPYSCVLCQFEMALNEYRAYRFDYDKYIKDHYLE